MTEETIATDVGLTFVNSHQHFQDLEAHYYPWLCDKSTPKNYRSMF